MTKVEKITPEGAAVDRMTAITIAYVRSEYHLSRYYKEGLVKHSPNSPPLNDTWQMICTCVGLFDRALSETDANVRVRLETSPGRKPPNDIRGLIFWTGTTKTVPVKVSPALVRIRKGEIFLDHPGGAKALLDFIRSELDSILAAEISLKS